MSKFVKLLGAVLLGLSVLLMNSLFIIGPTEGATIQRLGVVQEASLQPGLHTKIPLVESYTRYTVGVRKHEISVQSKTADLQPVAATFVLNIGIDRGSLPSIRRDLGSLNDLDDRIVIPQTQEAFNQAVAGFTAEEVITRRADLKASFDSLIASRLKPYGILVRDAAVATLSFSEKFDEAVEDKQVAEQNARKAAYVAEQAAQDAEAAINRARGSAEAQRLEAEALKSEGGALVLQARAIEKWDGHFPQVLGGDGVLPFINIERPQ